MVVVEAFKSTVHIDLGVFCFLLEDQENLINSLFQIEARNDFPELSSAELSQTQHVIHEEAQEL
jgi:hypothetical protein